MGGPIACTNQCGSESKFILTNLESGEVVSLCDPCFAGFILTMADQLAAGAQEGEPGEAQPAQDGRQEGEAPPVRQAPKRRRQGRQGASSALSGEASPFPDAAPVDR